MVLSLSAGDVIWCVKCTIKIENPITLWSVPFSSGCVLVKGGGGAKVTSRLFDMLWCGLIDGPFRRVNV